MDAPSTQSYSYCEARGETQRPPQDNLKRSFLPRMVILLVPGSRELVRT